MRKRIVITSFGSLGDIYPYLGLARQLLQRGHDPVFATSAYYRPLIEAEGVAFYPVRPDVNLEDRGLIRRLMDPQHGPAVLVREVLLPHLRHAYTDLAAATHGADLLVTHPMDARIGTTVRATTPVIVSEAARGSQLAAGAERAKHRRGHENRRVGTADVGEKKSSPLALARFHS